MNFVKSTRLWDFMRLSGSDIEVMWRLEVSDDNQTWTLADNRNTTQPVTYYRRRVAAYGSPEDNSEIEKCIETKMDFLDLHGFTVHICILTYTLEI